MFFAKAIVIGLVSGFVLWLLSRVLYSFAESRGLLSP
jgi:hypothetical protein